MPHPNTTAVHGTHPPLIDGAVVQPIFQAATYAFLEPDDAAERGVDPVRYTRYTNTPGQVELGRKLAMLEGAEAACVTASGMAAISAVLLSTLQAGDHMLIQNPVYGGTLDLVLNHLPRLGIKHTLIDGSDPASWAGALTRETKLIHVEAISNPLMQLIDLRAVTDFAKANSLTSTIDATFATPMNLRPIELGFDIVLHSATKYLGGHSDLCAGVVASTHERTDAAMRTMVAFGGSLDANSCFLLDRGLKTLHVRMPRHDENAAALARWLADQPGVAKVHHASLSDSPHKALFAGFGGMLGFELDPSADAGKFLRSVRLATHAASLGGVETLVVSPSRSSHAKLTAEERAAAGVSDGLIRVSVGIEQIDDLIADFAQAIALSRG